MVKRLLLGVLTGSALLMLMACGQTGPLYLPDENGEKPKTEESGEPKTGAAVWTDIGVKQ